MFSSLLCLIIYTALHILCVFNMTFLKFREKDFPDGPVVKNAPARITIEIVVVDYHTG